MVGYALVSAGDPADETWCSSGAILSHVSKVEQLVKMGRKNRHNLHFRNAESEMMVVAEWARVAQSAPAVSIADVIAIVSQRHTIRPCVAEFSTSTHGHPTGEELKGKGQCKNGYPANGKVTRTYELVHVKQAKCVSR